MKKYLISVLLLLLAVPAKAQSACTEEKLNFKINQWVNFRIYALQGQEKLPLFTQLGSNVIADFSTLHIEYEKNKKEGQAYLDRMCSIMDQIAMMADDLMGGGDGFGQKTPWKKQNPETFFKAVEEFKTFCGHSPLCNTYEAKQILEQIDALPELLFKGKDPAGLLDKNHEIIEDFLSQKQQSETGSSE